MIARRQDHQKLASKHGTSSAVALSQNGAGGRTWGAPLVAIALLEDPVVAVDAIVSAWRPGVEVVLPDGVRELARWGGCWACACVSG